MEHLENMIVRIEECRGALLGHSKGKEMERIVEMLDSNHKLCLSIYGMPSEDAVSMMWGQIKDNTEELLNHACDHMRSLGIEVDSLK